MSSENDVGQTRSGQAREQPSFTNLAERIGRSVSAAVIVGAFFIALAIYERPGPPRFQAFAVGDEIVRIDTREGAIIACRSGQCMNVRHRGQALVKALPEPDPVVSLRLTNAAH